MKISGIAAVITGGGSGIGAATARHLASLGAKVTVLDVNKDNAEAVAKEIGGLAVRADISRGDDVKAVAYAALDRFGGIDILVNNAGIGHKPQPLDTLTEEDFDALAGRIVDNVKKQTGGVLRG